MAARYGRRLLIVTGARSAPSSPSPRLSAYGMTAADIPCVVANCRGSSMKTNPIVLSDEEVARILGARL